MCCKAGRLSPTSTKPVCLEEIDKLLRINNNEKNQYFINDDNSFRGKAPRDHERQNEQVKSLAQKYKLTKEQQDKVHREISGQGYSYKEIEELIIEMFYE